MIAYRAMIDVPRELVQYLGRLLAAERRARGTRRDTRALTCFHQALLVLIWFRKAEDLTLLAAGFGISRATAYRYRDEGVAVLAAQATDLHTALRRAAADGWPYVILDGKLFDCDRLTETTLSVKGETIVRIQLEVSGGPVVHSGRSADMIMGCRPSRRSRSRTRIWSRCWLSCGNGLIGWKPRTLN
ncbi:transposase family protein [Micromonospora craniellae]|uniref:transposase family protein n=1 Tax=Micromonospora craniellae TaxID=2294034 RepID=UPI001CC3BF81|nr:transposase family protein [Micromonospora craniellae]